MSVSGGSHDAPFEPAVVWQAVLATATLTAGWGRAEPDPRVLAVLADWMADQIAQRLASTIAWLVSASTSHSAPARPPSAGPETDTSASGTRGIRTDTDDPRPRLWTAGRVAEHYDVDPSFVYQHADELGCIRLGDGRCARLRFDPNVVRERLRTIGKPQAAPPRARPRSPRGRRMTPRRDGGNFELLDFDREP